MDRSATVLFAYVSFTFFGLAAALLRDTQETVTVHANLTGIEMRTAPSIFPCLDTFDLWLLNLNISSEQFEKNIRVYTTNDRELPLRYFQYISEYKLPVNNVLKLNCHFFSPSHKYYCFLLHTISILDRRSVISEPMCKPTSMHLLDKTPARNGNEQDVNITTLAPHGPSFQIKPLKVGQQFTVNMKAAVTVNDREPLIEHIVFCNCSEFISINLNKFASLTLETMKCGTQNSAESVESVESNSQSELNHSRVYSTLDTRSASIETLCILNFTQSKVRFEVQILYTNKASERSHSSLTTNVLKIRDGFSSIDPLLRIGTEFTEHELRSQYLRVEASFDFEYKLRIAFKEANNQTETMVVDGFGLTPVRLTILCLFSLIIAALFVFSTIAVTTKRRLSKVQISVEEETHTIQSMLQPSSLDNFSFADSESLEMDYYDYLVPFVAKSESF